MRLKELAVWSPAPVYAGGQCCLLIEFVSFTGVPAGPRAITVQCDAGFDVGGAVLLRQHCCCFHQLAC